MSGVGRHRFVPSSLNTPQHLNRVWVNEEFGSGSSAHVPMRAESRNFRFCQTPTLVSDVRTKKTEIINHAKLMPTIRSNHKSNEVPTDLGSGSVAPTTPGNIGVERQVGIGRRRCVSVDRSLNLERPDPIVVGSHGSDVVGGGLLHLRYIPVGMQQQEDPRGSSAASARCRKK